MHTWLKVHMENWLINTKLFTMKRLLKVKDTICAFDWKKEEKKSVNLGKAVTIKIKWLVLDNTYAYDKYINWTSIR